MANDQNPHRIDLAAAEMFPGSVIRSCPGLPTEESPRGRRSRTRECPTGTRRVRKRMKRLVAGHAPPSPP